jgi:hypothetical protein
MPVRPSRIRGAATSWLISDIGHQISVDLRRRWTAQRTQNALEVTLDSIVFRTTDQPLTITGIWTTDAARILGPTLLVLALLAVRIRVKR